MIGYYPYFTVALLLIHAHSTTQSWLLTDPTELIGLLGSERTENGDADPNYICDELSPERKQKLCEEAMVHVVRKDHKIKKPEKVGQFLEKDSSLEVPQLVDQDEPYKCKKITIDGLEPPVEKRMYWCRSRVYKKNKKPDEIHVAGFFVSDSRMWIDTVFLFRAPSTDSQRVHPYGKLSKIDLRI